MSPRNPELPEGTDHIINGALETSGTDTAASASVIDGGTGMNERNDTAGGFVGSSTFDDTGGTSAGSSTAGIKEQLKEGASGLQAQAGEKIRTFAETGKERATSALDDLTQLVNDAAGEIDERLGSEYGEYARRAADAVSNFADSIRGKDVDELYEDGKALVRKSPGVALGIAAVVGFTLVRVVKTGLEAPARERDVEFTPSPQLAATDNIGD